MRNFFYAVYVIRNKNTGHQKEKLPTAGNFVGGFFSNCFGCQTAFKVLLFRKKKEQIDLLREEFIMESESVVDTFKKKI